MIRNIFIYKNLKYCLLFFCSLIYLSGCSTVQYKALGNIEKLKTNSLSQESIDKISVSQGNKNYLLASQEQGRQSFLIGNNEVSNKYFSEAVVRYNQLDEQALLNISKVTSTAFASTITSDNTLDYVGSDYERTLAHFYRALNYLSLGEKEKSMVEVRAASNIQKFAESKRQRRIQKVEVSAQNVRLRSSQPLNQVLNDSNDILSKGKKGFVNPYVYYISGKIRELQGDYNGALVDYKKAKEIIPNNSFLNQDLLRLSKIFDSSYFNILVTQVGNDYINQSEYQKLAKVIVIYEQGFVPIKEELSIPIFIDDILYQISLPIYNTNQKELKSVYLNVNDQNVLFEEIGNNYVLAKNDLAERYSGIITRQITRLISKGLIQNELDKKDNGLATAGQIGIVFTSIFETADLRSFVSLPSRIAVANYQSSEVIKDVDISLNGGIFSVSDINIQPGQTALLLIVDTGQYVYKRVLYK